MSEPVVKHRKRVYVCTPYTHPDPEVVEARYKTARVVTEAINRTAGFTAFSPIVHGHKLNLPKFDHDKWMELDEPWLQVCDLLVYVTCPGWEHSHGMKHEMDYARWLGKPVVSLEQFMERGL
jgi:hypothetical protein